MSQKLERLKGQEGKKIPTGLKATFLVHFIVATVFGLFFVLIPGTFASWVNTVAKETSMYRLTGAALLGFAVSSLYAYRQSLWQQVKIVVEMEVTWCVLGTAVTLYSLAYESLPVGEWMNVLILAVFGTVFATYYFRTRK